jgi:hypothetical protein
MNEPVSERDFGTLTRQIAKLRQTEELAAELACKINPLASDPQRELPWTPRSFWWNYLRLNCPVAIAELDRIEGLQKQFRSLVVVAGAAAFFALEALVQWHIIKGSLDKPDRWKVAFAPLWAVLPWVLAAIAFYPPRTGIRLVGVTVSKFADPVGASAAPLPLFGAAESGSAPPPAMVEG